MSDMKKTILVYHKDRYSIKGSRAVDRYMREHLNCNWVPSTNWENFLKKLDTKPDLIGLNAEILDEPNFLESLTTLRTLMCSKNLHVPIGIGILRHTTRESIELAREQNILGILPAARYLGKEIAAQYWAKLLNHEPTWPEDLINQAPRLLTIADTRPLAIFFRPNDISEYFNSMGLNKEEVFSTLPCQVKFAHSFKELGEAIKLAPKFILIDYQMIKKHGLTFHEFNMMFDTMVRYTNSKTKIDLAIAIGNDISMDEIKEFQRSGISGIVPKIKDYGVEESRKGIISIIEGKPYWPKHIIDQLPGSKPFSKKLKDFHLTDRQRQVFELIANRGLSNKQIATVLRISESTVKIHVSAVMKTMCVRNRTQLALTAK